MMLPSRSESSALEQSVPAGSEARRECAGPPAAVDFPGEAGFSRPPAPRLGGGARRDRHDFGFEEVPS